MEPSENKQEKGQFVQFPFHMIYGRTDLTRDDKWVLIAIMGKCWTEGLYPLSYREIASLSDVPLALLSSSQDKKTGAFHEGILNRLARLGDIRIVLDKEINPTTGKPRGQTKTFISINYSRMWQQNLTYCEEGKSVPYTNTSVPIPNTSVPNQNTSVPNTNAIVRYQNDSVQDSRTKEGTYITRLEDAEDTKEKEDTKTSIDAPTNRPSFSSPNEHLNGKKSAIQTPSKSKKPVQATLPTEPEIILTAEEQRIHDLYSQLWFMATPLKLNDKIKGQWAILAPYVKTKEDMDSLEQFARQELRNRGHDTKVVHPGNLTNSLNNWIQTKHIKEPAPPPNSRLVRATREYETANGGRKAQ